MKKETAVPGLAYRKLDLHVHSPSSHDYQDKSIAPTDIVNKALEQGLDAIAITDHNTGEYIDKIKEAAKGKIVVFPGVEISVAGGKEGNLHVIGLFNQEFTTKDIENLLGFLSIEADKYGTEQAFSSESIFFVIDEIYKRGGLPILAHANSSHGALTDLRGNPRTELIQMKNLAAVEATESDFNNVEKKSNHKRLCDRLDGTDPTYHIEKAVYQSSDSHSLDNIGSNFSYFKLDEITIDGLRQCFFDPRVRIRQKEDFELNSLPKITGIEISEGFLKDQKINFHDGLNCLVGGKGVGKSLIVEFLRFGLNQCSKDKIIRDDHYSKIEKRLGHFGEVKINFELENGEKYQIKRQFDGDDNPLECIHYESKDPYNGEIAKIFPVLFYSQNEIIRTADDSESQLRLIDSFIDPSIFNSNISSIQSTLLKIDKELSESISAVYEIAGANTDLEGVSERLKNIDLALKNELYTEIKKWEKDNELYEGYLSYHDLLIENLEKSKNEISKLSINDFKNVDEPTRIELEKITDKSRKNILKLFDSTMKEIDRNRSSIKNKFDLWLPKFVQKREEYVKMIQDSGGDKSKLESERRRLNKQFETLSAEFKILSGKQENFQNIIKKRNEWLDRLDSVYNEYYNARKGIFDRLNYQSEGKLLLKLDQNGNRDDFKRELLYLKKGTKIREPDINKIAQKILPRKFVDLLIKSDADNLAAETGLALNNAQKLIESLNSKENLVDVLSLAYLAYPKDIPSIEFKKEDGQYYPLSELSGGQKSIALLIIALSEGTKPIIIDQPEDSLDNPSVYEDIVSKLRTGKEKRQFILTTHNSNIGVASDSDNFIVLKSSAKTGKIECFGAIDRNDVRAEIINHLEGGDIPYELKNKKYHII
ncbi:MAG: PHP domain-containing protein [Methanoregula sp.]|jgi:hypothetical protein